MIPVIAIMDKGLALYLYNKRRETLKIRIAEKFIVDRSVINLGDPQNAIKTMLKAEEAINPIDVARRPFKILEILSMFLYFLKKLNNNIENTVPNNMDPIVATTAPIIPAILIPTNVDIFIAKGPGVICEIVIISVNSCNVSQPLETTILSCIRGIMA